MSKQHSAVQYYIGDKRSLRALTGKCLKEHLKCGPVPELLEWQNIHVYNFTKEVLPIKFANILSHEIIAIYVNTRVSTHQH